MASAAATRDPHIFAQINVTPFIDVLLVLLIMLILTIPVATHKLPVDLPTPQDERVPPATPHQLAIDAGGALYWDGRRIADAELPALLAAAVRTDVPLAMNPDAQTRYERFEQVLAKVRRAGVTRLGFMGAHRLQD